MNALQASLTAANVDTSKFTLTPREDLYWTPFGSFYNRTIEVSTPNGQWELLSADLTVKNPDIAVDDIERMLGTLSA